MMLLGILIGVVFGAAAAAATMWWSRRPHPPTAPTSLPADLDHVMDLIRRAHGAVLTCLVGPDEPPVTTFGRSRPTEALVDRAVAIAKIAMEDGRERIIPGEEGQATSIVAVGDLSLGAAVAFAQASPPDDTTESVVGDLRRLLAEVRVDLAQTTATAAGGWGRRSALPTGLDTLPAVASGLCEQARGITGRATAVVARDRTTERAKIVAVSQGADRRLLRQAVNPNSAAGRACIGEVPVIARSGDDLFGRISLPGDRRRSHEEGTAYPLWDGRDSVGALVVFGPTEGMAPPLREEVLRLAVATGPRFAAAAAVKAAEDRALRDNLTGLENRAALDQAMAMALPDAPCSLLCVDLDDFKKINDGFGHAAGDAALKHVARVFRDALREDDVAARVGGEEFALWLPGASQAVAVEIAERIRRATAETRWEWTGAEIKLRCSIGVASRPETTPEVANLFAAADAALYRAKRAGRNRVEVATPTR